MFLRETHRALSVVALIVLAAQAAGCMSPGDGSPEAPSGIVSFTATYWVGDPESNSRMRLALDGVETIRDGSGEEREAYRLEIVNYDEVEGDEYRTVVHLDGNLTLARIEDPCSMGRAAGDCSARLLLWMFQGGLAPQGVGYAQVFQSGTTSLLIDGGPSVVAATMERSGDDVRIQIADPGSSWGDSTGAYVYSNGNPFPTVIEQPGPSGTPFRRALLSSSIGEMLPPIPAWRHDDRPRPDEGAEPPALYWGGDEDYLGFGFTALDAYHYLLENDTEARAAIDGGGCVEVVHYARSYAEDPDGVTSIVAQRQLRVEIRIVEPAGAMTSYLVQYTEDWMQPPLITHSKLAMDPAGPCDRDGTPPPFVGSIAELRARAAGIIPEMPLDPGTYVALDRWASRGASDGQMSIGFSIVPEGQTFGPTHTIEVDPHVGRLVQVNLPTAIVDRLEREWY